MNRERIEKHFKSIYLDNNAIDPMDMTDVVKALIGRPLEAVMPATDRAAMLLSSGGHTSERTAMAIPDGSKIWSPPCTSDYRHCLVLDTREGQYAVMLHLDNEPVSWQSDINEKFDKILVDKGLTVEKRTSIPGEPKKIVVCRIWPQSELSNPGQPSLSEVMKVDQEKGYLPSLCFSRSDSTGGRWRDHGWTDGQDDLKGQGMDKWPGVFRKLGSAIIAAGAADVLRESVKEVGARNWWRHDRNGLSRQVACEAFADDFHAEHGMFLGFEAKKAVQTLQAMALETDADYLAKRISILKPMLEDGGHRSKDTAHVCDDTENHTWLDGEGAVVFDDQNHTTRVTMDDTSLIVEDLRRGLSPVCFTLEGGQAHISAPPDLESDAVRTWNSVTLNTETVLHRISDNKERGRKP